MPPTKSACPGRGLLTRRIFFCFSGTGSTDITEVQFFQSLFSTINVTGEPSVLPCRMPEVIRTWSFSIFIRPPRP